jgi:proteasome lid subunit RPN8/RPN11
VSAHGTLVLPDACRRRIIRHARREAPRECCGFLIGRPGHVSSVVEVANVALEATRYRVDPREHIALRRSLRTDPRGLTIVGVYHSHPAAPAAPSSTDVAEAHYPDWAYVIVGLAGRRAQLRAFDLARGTVSPIVLHRPAVPGASRPKR